MDQVRVALAWIKKHHFWLLCGSVVAIGAVSWFMASGALAKAFDENSKKIAAEFSNASNVRNSTFIPNTAVNEAQQGQNVTLSEVVGALWLSKYQRQRDLVLKWPEQLGEDFLERIESRQFGDDIPRALREVYLNYIQTFFPELPKIIQAQKIGASTGGYRGGGGGGFGGGFGGDIFAGPSPTFGPAGGGRRSGSDDEEEEEVFIVQWADQERIREDLSMGRKTPSSLHIWVTQEDLWVYITLLRAIANANEAAGSDRYSNAAVRDIAALQVGKLAGREKASGARLFRPESTASAGGGDAFFGESVGPSADFDAVGPDFSGALPGGEGSESQTLLAGRYLDADGAPLPVAEGDFRFGTEFKRLPIRLELRMDRRWLPRLISELSNAPLQVEVNEVRINPGSKSGRGFSGGGRGLSSGLSTSGSSEVLAFPSEPNIGEVILRGVVYIYNPVDEAVLSVGDAEA